MPHDRDLTGLRVKLSDKFCCGVNGIIARPDDADEFQIWCAFCNERSGVLPVEVVEFLRRTVRLFGAPDEIVIPSAIIRDKGLAMNREAIFPSRYFKAADLLEPLSVIVAGVE
jgi:hypothetical protein